MFAEFVVVELAGDGLSRCEEHVVPDTLVVNGDKSTIVFELTLSPPPPWWEVGVSPNRLRRALPGGGLSR